MAERVATSLLEFISDKLGSMALSKFELQTSVHKEVRKLKITLSTIQDVLEDAETRQVKEKALRSWLRQLKDLAYDVNDVLDDIAFKAENLKKANVKEKVCNFFSHSKDQREIDPRVKEINERLESEETGSFLKESEVHGREEDKEKIIEFLMNASTGGEIDVIGIVGLGGLGKTTLAGLVYNDERVCGHFEKRMWVSVPKEFGIKKVIRLIIESATGREYPPINMNEMQISLKNELKKKRFLLVLDDVLNESHQIWDSLSSLPSVGAKGSKVIVTTRNEQVASMMATIPPCRLSTLSLDDCWLLLERRAFGNGVERNLNLVLMGKEIAHKCGGVPLATKALGSLLRFKRTESEWLAIKNSELWELCDVENYFLPALKLSYDHFSSSLKQCFSYCSIFPKKFCIETHKLVKLWGAEGFLKPIMGHIHWEQIGLQYVDELLTRSLFQERDNGRSELHDLVHDLA